MNKTVLVAGAAGTLGVETVKALINAGAKVIAADLKLETMQRSFAGSCDINHDNLSLIQLDVTDELAVKSIFKKIDRLDGAVNCTYPRGVDYGKHFFDVTLDSFNENVSLHLGSSFLFAQTCAKYFLDHKHPFSLVNISSIYGVMVPDFNIYKGTQMTMPVEYAAIKAGLIHLNGYISAYVNDSRFRINSVSPGGIYAGQPDSFCEAYKSKTHGAGMLSAKDMVGSILFLLSDSSKYVVGQNIIVDDGFSF